MEIPRHWRLKKQRYSLVGDRCPMCNTPHFPPIAVCPDCRETVDKGQNTPINIGNSQLNIVDVVVR